MDKVVLISSLLLLLLIIDSRAQLFNFDFFNIPPREPTTKYVLNDATTRKTKVNTVRTDDPNTQIQWKNTSISYVFEDIDRDEQIQPVREKKRKPALLIPTLAPIFNFFTTTTQRTIKKNKATSSQRSTIVNSNENKKKNSYNVRLSYETDLPKNRQSNNVFLTPEVTNEFLPYYEITTKTNYYNNNNYFNKEHTTKNPLLHRPGVKPAVVENRPPITNRPPARRPVPPPNRDQNQVETTTKAKFTPRPYLVNPIPTDPGAVVFPHENDEPEIIKGVDEEYMSDAERRRYIEIAETMCDKYKSLNTKQLSAIPLLPSPEPVSVNVSECSPLNVPLVIGGKVVSIREFPHAALLGWEKIDEAGYSWKCGGSLVSDRWVLTAAHCSYEERDNTVVTGPPRVAQLGSTYLDDPGALVVRVGSVVRHPKYKFPRSYYDIALLKLVQPVKFSEVIRPACIGVPPPVGDPIIAVGWGKTQLGGNLSMELRAVSIPIWDLGRCKEVLGTSRKMPDGPLSDSQVCAGEERGGKDTCQGDSGGPAQIQDGCVWRVIAVTSLGRSCGAPNTPGLYAIAQRVFIAATIFGNQKNNNRRSDDTETRINNNNNNRQNDFSNLNVNINHNTYIVNNNNENRNDYPNVNSNNNRRHNDLTTKTTTVLYYNYNSHRTTTTTTTEPYYNLDYNNRHHGENGYNHDSNNSNHGETGYNQSENTRDYDSSGNLYGNNKRTHNTGYNNDNNSQNIRTRPNYRESNYDDVRYNQQNNHNHYQNNHNEYRGNDGNQNYYERPNFYGRRDDAPVWWT